MDSAPSGTQVEDRIKHRTGMSEQRVQEARARGRGHGRCPTALVRGWEAGVRAGAMFTSALGTNLTVATRGGHCEPPI